MFRDNYAYFSSAEFRVVVPRHPPWASIFVVNISVLNNIRQIRFTFQKKNTELAIFCVNISVLWHTASRPATQPDSKPDSQTLDDCGGGTETHAKLSQANGKAQPRKATQDTANQIKAKKLIANRSKAQQTKVKQSNA